MGNSANELLDRLVAAGARLLHVERAPPPGPAGPRRCGRLRLTFDRGCLELGPAREGPGLEAEGAEPTAPGAGLLRADEEDPWWTVLGQPLTRVWARRDGSLLLQFRPEGDAPKRILLAREPGALVVRSEKST